MIFDIKARDGSIVAIRSRLIELLERQSKIFSLSKAFMMHI